MISYYHEGADGREHDISMTPALDESKQTLAESKERQ
jgi:hypothetical protein